MKGIGRRPGTGAHPACPPLALVIGDAVTRSRLTAELILAGIDVLVGASLDQVDDRWVVVTDARPDAAPGAPDAFSAPGDVPLAAFTFARDPAGTVAIRGRHLVRGTATADIVQAVVLLVQAGGGSPRDDAIEQPGIEGDPQRL